MIIVSQDRKTIVNFNNVLKIDCVNDEIIVFYKSEEVPGVDGTESIGFYGTEERAKEVLQEIIKAIVYSRKSEEAKSTFGFSLIESNIYYEMPED